MTISVYNAHWLRLAVHRDCLTRNSNTDEFSQLSLHVLFITTIRLRWRWIMMTIMWCTCLH